MLFNNIHNNLTSSKKQANKQQTCTAIIKFNCENLLMEISFSKWLPKYFIIQKMSLGSYINTAKFLFHQSPTRYTDWSQCSTCNCCQLLVAQWLSCQWQCSLCAAGSCKQWLHHHSPVTMKSLCIVGDWWNRSFAEVPIVPLCMYYTYTCCTNDKQGYFCKQWVGFHEICVSDLEEFPTWGPFQGKWNCFFFFREKISFFIGPHK